jgi:hypothetical protein
VLVAVVAIIVFAVAIDTNINKQASPTHYKPITHLYQPIGDSPYTINPTTPTPTK